MKRIIPLFAILILVAFGSYFLIKDDSTESNISDISAEPVDSNQELNGFNKNLYSLDDEASLWVVVNKNRSIPLDYVPDSLRDVEVNKRDDKSSEELMLRSDAALALEQLFAAAEQDSIALLLGSAYRSSDLQTTYYNSYVSQYGQEEADKFSARPGTSEHQTGLAADVSPSSKNCYLEICFADTPEGRWVKEHAHEYGFTIRYPEGKENITTYQYEPWHLRYVGIDLAYELRDANQTLEEFFGL